MMPFTTDQSSNHFGWIDYLIFALTLVLSLFIGIHHAWKGAANSTNDYLFGGKSMKIFPIAMSFAASVVSTQSMLGLPTEVYLTGAMILWQVVAISIGTSFAAYVYLPLFHDLGILSINQYLEMRFHSIVRRIYSIISIFSLLFFLSMVTYGPSLALSQVTGLNVYISATITFAVCTFYTTIGGLKAVVWSDTIQIFLMIGSVATLMIKGLLDVGLENVWERNINSNRLEFFNIDPNPTTQKTIWSVVGGGSLFWIGIYGIGQGAYQRFQATSSRRRSQFAMLLNIIVVVVFVSLCCLTGLVAYSKYFDCDPIKAKLVEKADQIVPYFVMDTLGSIPGMPGLFVAGLFSASLSTLSTHLNGIALTILEDFIRPFHPNLGDGTATRISKIISCAFGFISYALVFLVSNVKTLFETGHSISGAGLGMSLGIFTLGLLNPWSNTIGAILGMVLSYAAVLLLGIFTQTARSKGLLPNKQLKSTSIENCPSFNGTFQSAYYYKPSNITITQFEEEPCYLLRISFLWYTTIGTLIVITIGSLVSYLTGPQNPDQLDPKLVFPFFRRWIGRKREELLNMKDKTRNVASSESCA